MKLTKYSQLKHGMRVTCNVNGEEITDAKLSIDGNGDVFICQDKIGGLSADDKLGYIYSFNLAFEGEDIEDWSPGIKNLRTKETTKEIKLPTNQISDYIWYLIMYCPDGNDNRVRYWKAMEKNIKEEIDRILNSCACGNPKMPESDYCEECV